MMARGWTRIAGFVWRHASGCRTSGDRQGGSAGNGDRPHADAGRRAIRKGGMSGHCAPGAIRIYIVTTHAWDGEMQGRIVRYGIATIASPVGTSWKNLRRHGRVGGRRVGIGAGGLPLQAIDQSYACGTRYRIRDRWLTQPMAGVGEGRMIVKCGDCCLRCTGMSGLTFCI